MLTTTHLGHLEGAGLIKLAALQPEVEYSFRHGLFQEAAYFSLVKGDRRALHRAVGETLEQLFLGQPVRSARELLPVLAHHFAEADDAARALAYFTQAGDAAAGQYANAEAIAHYSRALEFALPHRATPAQAAHLFSQRGRAQELSGQFDAALDNYLQWETAAQQRGDRALANVAERRGDLPAAQHWRAEARRHLDFIIQSLDEPELRASFLAQPDVRATLEAA